jgi:hypothetical protein
MAVLRIALVDSTISSMVTSLLNITSLKVVTRENFSALVVTQLPKQNMGLLEQLS